MTNPEIEPRRPLRGEAVDYGAPHRPRGARLYNRRMIGHRVAGHMLCAARILRHQAERLSPTSNKRLGRDKPVRHDRENRFD
jgi:hypothetical protein